MGDDRRRVMSTLSPVPSEDIHTLSKNIQRVGTAVTRIEATLGTIKNDLLPPVSESAKEARDGVLQLNQRVSSLEQMPNPKHECYEVERQTKQDTEIAESRIRVLNLWRLVWWMIGIAVMVGASAIGFAILTRSVAAENSTRIENIGGDIERHEENIKTIRKSQEDDRRIYLKEIRALPVKVQQAAEKRDITIDEVLDTTDDFPLTRGERELMERILKKARKREQR